MAFEAVLESSQLKPGAGTKVKLGEKVLALFNYKGDFHAIQDFCTHRGGSLAVAEVDDDGLVACPLHAWFFDVTSGECVNMPQGHTFYYACKVEDGQVMIDPDSERRYQA